MYTILSSDKIRVSRYGIPVTTFFVGERTVSAVAAVVVLQL